MYPMYPLDESGILLRIQGGIDPDSQVNHRLPFPQAVGDLGDLGL